MKSSQLAVAVLAALVVGPQMVQPASAAQAKNRNALPPVQTKAPPEPVLTKVVTYGQRDVVRLNTKVRYTTFIVLPKDEVILDYVCGDSELWQIQGEQNFAYVKPSKEGLETSLGLVTESGNVYSFILNEISGPTGKAPDLKVFIEASAATLAESVRPRRLASTKELDELREQLDRAKSELASAKADADQRVEQRVTQMVRNVRFPYRFDAGKKPFNVRAIYHDDRFTYILARPEETPTLMELRDGKPNLVNFTYENDRYVADKIIDKGYLVVGKGKLAFSREE